MLFHTLENNFQQQPLLHWYSIGDKQPHFHTLATVDKHIDPISELSGGSAVYFNVSKSKLRRGINPFCGRRREMEEVV